jgi:hypothetical protein
MPRSGDATGVKSGKGTGKATEFEHLFHLLAFIFLPTPFLPFGVGGLGLLVSLPIPLARPFPLPHPKGALESRRCM